MQIHGPSNIHGPQPINPPHRTQGAAPSEGTTQTHQADQLDISREADLVSRARELPSVRAERVASIRAEIEAGTYETEQKLETAVGRLLDELVG